MNQKNKFNDLLIFDSHCDTANVIYDQSSYFIKENQAHLTLEKAKMGGLKSQIFALYVNPVYAPHQSLKRALKLYNVLEKRLFSTEQAVKVTSTPEMKSAIKQNKLACWLSLESGDIIENSLDILEFFYHLGIRCMTLTHTKNTDWADSSGDTPEHDGLTRLGKEIITTMNKIGMIIDISHTADKTVEDVLEITSAPIMASHSCSRALCDIPRNLSDDFIKEISEKNGYIGVNFFPGFLNKTIYEKMMKNLETHKEWFSKICKKNEGNPDKINEAEMELYSKIVQDLDSVDVSSVIAHITHIVDIGGINCVGIGSDFDGIPLTPTNLTDVLDYPILIEGLMEKGFNRKDVAKIMGFNLMHFLTQFDGGK